MKMDYLHDELIQLKLFPQPWLAYFNYQGAIKSLDVSLLPRSITSDFLG